MAVVYGGFALALVALLLLIYQDGCTYTADMIIVLNILRGGRHLVIQPITSGAFDAKDVDWSEFKVVALLIPLILISAWSRMRVDIFAKYSLLRVLEGPVSFSSRSNMKSESQFAAFLSVWFASAPMWEQSLHCWLDQGVMIFSSFFSYGVLYILVGGVHFCMLVCRRVLQNVQR
jgi:hypothetical protein